MCILLFTFPKKVIQKFHDKKIKTNISLVLYLKKKEKKIRVEVLGYALKLSFSFRIAAIVEISSVLPACC